jgi:hypothetical protein
MAETADYLREAGSTGARNSPGAEEIRRQLRSMLESPVLHGSKRCKQFLEYICEKSLAGEADTLKERTIAVEVFGRAPQSDLGEDTIVRVGAREVRKRLAQYYVTPEGLSAEVHIDLLPGSYAPEFRYTNALKELKEEMVKGRVPAPAALLLVGEPRKPRRNLKVWVAGALMLVTAFAIFGVLKWTGANASEEGYRRFWEPVFRSSDPLLLAMANPLVYHPSGRAIRMSAENQPPTTIPIQRPIQVPSDKLDGSDLIPVPNQYVGYGDMVVATEVAALLGRKGKQVRVRLASSVQFADFRKGQTLLIGAITNHWTLELSQAWRFQFAANPGLETFIVDTMAPHGPPETRGRWRVPSSQDGSAPEDYMLICRIRNSIAGGFVIVAAGVKQFGTEAAGRLLTDPAQLSAVLAKLPHGWEEKNLQIVLHAKVISNTPGQPEVEASYVW